MSQSHLSALELFTREARDMSLLSIPETVKRQAKLCVLDTVGCILAGSRTEEAQLILACEPGTGNDVAAIYGTPHRRALREAVRVNGYLGDVLELNDLIGGHASIGNVSAALALGEVQRVSGAKVLEAVVRGIEVTSRIYDAVYSSLRRYTEMGLVPVGIPSTIGVATAAAHLLDLNNDQTLNALSIAGGLAGWCPAEVIFGRGGSVKPMLFGAQPGDVGVVAAQYARAGMSGPVNLLDGKVGYFATASTHGHFDPTAWDGRWALDQPRRKLHACCGYLHAPIDALNKIRREHGQTALDKGTIQVRVAPYVADVVSKERMPDSSNDSRFHLQYCLALVACGASVILPEHSIEVSRQLQREEVVEAMRRITVIQDPEISHYHHCKVEVADSAGTIAVQTVTAPRGSPQEPLVDEDVIAKFQMLAEPVLGLERTQEVISICLGLDEIPDIRELLIPLSLDSIGASV